MAQIQYRHFNSGMNVLNDLLPITPFTSSESASLQPCFCCVFLRRKERMSQNYFELVLNQEYCFKKTQSQAQCEKDVGKFISNKTKNTLDYNSRFYKSLLSSWASAQTPPYQVHIKYAFTVSIVTTKICCCVCVRRMF